MANRNRLAQAAHTTKGGTLVQANLGIHGVDETVKALNSMGNDVKFTAIKNGVTSAGQLLRQAMLAGVNSSGRKTITVEREYGKGKRKFRLKQKERNVLKKALNVAKSVMQRKSHDGTTMVWVGATWKRYGRPYNAWYQHFYEFGHKARNGTWVKGAFYANNAYKLVKDKCVRIIDWNVRKVVSKY